MAEWKTHLLLGTLLSVIFTITILVLGWAQTSTILIYAPIAVFIGTLLPDIDHHNGMLRTILLGTGILLAIAGLAIQPLLYVGLALAATAFIMPYIFPHRGFIHSITTAAIYGGIALLLTSSLLIGEIAAFSFWTHLLLDKIPFKLT
jgi:hypothetical protein